jgi:hypothetical protein
MWRDGLLDAVLLRLRGRLARAQKAFVQVSLWPPYPWGGWTLGSVDLRAPVFRQVCYRHNHLEAESTALNQKVRTVD